MEATTRTTGGRFHSPGKFSLRFRPPNASSRQRCIPCSLSMNGSGGGGSSDRPISMSETRTLPAVAAADAAVSQLKLAISALETDPPSSSSGIIRLEVPIMEKISAIDWLGAQQHLPRCYFSGRAPKSERDIIAVAGNGNGFYHGKGEQCLVGVAGVGSAVYFRGFGPFAKEDWKSIKRFLSKDCPLVRAYGAIRFDATRDISIEWKEFGSFYFIVPQVEFDEFEDGSMLATTIAWDDSLLWPWEQAMDGLQATMNQLFLGFNKLAKPLSTAAILSFSHVPSEAAWNVSVKKALQIIDRGNTDLIKVVLARCTRCVTNSAIDPLALLASLQVEGKNAYQFYIQPPNSPAFIGNTSSYFTERFAAYQVKL
ncbi:hypothetical protein HPP92_007667 [Vanilla planifolia]|uniref:Isochorismate synthase n=1 Tax=Vanilla planifolia TaxID=51239 RepID=A0A835RAM3_VANPL|nr:hypothetical protein HPP92_007667 [Vanilla planifolia]